MKQDIKKIIVSKIMTDDEIKSREGEYFNEDHYHTIINEDCDVYSDTGLLLLKLRKNVIDSELGKQTVLALRNAAKKKHENRGAAAGELNRNKMARYIGEFVTPGKFRTRFKSNSTGILSKQATSNLSPSNIIGFFDKPDRNLKGKGSQCRLTAFNRDYPELWNKTEPFIQACDNQFKILVPERYKIQKSRAQEVPDFSIKNTAFSTITINYSWRTALHRDKGDLVEGFGNIIVLEDHLNKNAYTGGYTGFPQYGVAANIRHGDFMAMNVHEWHCNTEMKPVFNEVFGKWKKKDITNGWHYNRLSLVCYLREKMIRCKNMDTNKIQLLKKKTDSYNIFNDIKKIPRPNTKKEYLDFLKKLENKLKYHLKKQIINDKTKLKIETIVNLYITYFIYYYKEFKDQLSKNKIKKIINLHDNIIKPNHTNKELYNQFTIIINYLHDRTNIQK